MLQSVAISSGVGKSHIAQALGHAACRRGYTVAFAKTSRLLADLAGGHADHTWAARLRRWARPDILICDDFAMRAFIPSVSPCYSEAKVATVRWPRDIGAPLDA